VADDQSSSRDAVRELLTEHSRIVEEKARLMESRQTPPTRMNFELTGIIRQMMELAQARRDAGHGQGEELRSLLREEAEKGHPAAGDALDLLADEDPWWGER
jgi:hypothetical protein